MNVIHFYYLIFLQIKLLVLPLRFLSQTRHFTYKMNKPCKFLKFIINYECELTTSTFKMFNQNIFFYPK